MACVGTWLTLEMWFRPLHIILYVPTNMHIHLLAESRTIEGNLLMSEQSPVYLSYETYISTIIV
jgi:hypothetical protein